MFSIDFLWPRKEEDHCRNQISRRLWRSKEGRNWKRRRRREQLDANCYGIQRNCIEILQRKSWRSHRKRYCSLLLQLLDEQRILLLTKWSFVFYLLVLKDASLNRNELGCEKVLLRPFKLLVKLTKSFWGCQRKMTQLILCTLLFMDWVLSSREWPRTIWKEWW